MANEQNNLLASIFASGATDLRGPADLSQFENTIARNNIYRQIAVPVVNTKFNTGTWNNGTTAGVSFAQAFLGSALNALGSRSEATQLAAANQVMPQLAVDPLNTPTPVGVDPQAFEELRAQKIQQKALRDAEVASSLQSSLGQKLIKYDPQTGGVSVIPGADNVAAQLFGKKGNEDQIKLAKDLENTTYNRVTNLPQYKMFADVESNVKALKDLVKQDSKAADIGIISTISRIRDPNSTVREGEYKINAETQAYLDSLYGDWRSIVTGKGRFEKKDLANIVDSVLPKYNELGLSYAENKNNLLKSLAQQGGDPNNVPVPDFKPLSLKDFGFKPKLSREDIIAELARRQSSRKGVPIG